MAERFSDRLQHAWNAFMSRSPTEQAGYNVIGPTYSYRPDRSRLRYNNSRNIVSVIYNRIAVDVYQIAIKHVRVNERGQYVETMNSLLNNALTINANDDQTGTAFIQDVVLSMFDEGCVAIVPTDTNLNPKTNSFDVEKMRTARVIEWAPKQVKVECYNENSGQKEQIWMPKSAVAIIENPFYAVMNEPNSTLQRLIRAINDLDLINKQNSSGKLDLIIQLPYIVKTEARKAQAEKRRKDIVDQLTGSNYGIAYTDGTEKITQLNRSVDNQLWQQVQDLTSMLYNQLGMTQSILDGTADEKTVLNYRNSTLEPILKAICDAMVWKFLTKTARTQGQSIKFFSEPFKLVPVNELADIADKFTRNEIASSNEMRAVIGWTPVDDPRADELRNKNINQSTDEAQQPPVTTKQEKGDATAYA